jgi:peptidoglycan/LPS O-acetylase OafA/YrhL
MLISNASFQLRYGTIIGASLPFSMGAMMYYTKNKLLNLSKIHLVIAVILFIIYASFSQLLWTTPKIFGFYISLIIGFYLQLSLSKLRQKDMPQWLNSIDNRLGNLAYPVFLCHWHVGAVIVFIAPMGVSEKGLNLCILTFWLSIIVALAINYCIEQPIEKIRKKFKQVIHS